MNNRILKKLPFLFLILLFYGCDCGNITCPGLGSQYDEWLPYKTGDEITYTNNHGEEIRFTVTDYQPSIDRIEECSKNGFGGCYCSDCPIAFIKSRAANTDTSRKKGKIAYNSISTYADNINQNGDSIFLSYTIFDNTNTIMIHPNFEINTNDSLLNTYTFGNKTYNNVIVHERDTTYNPNLSPAFNINYAWKSYYTKEYGVVAFYDLKTRSLFYRK